jgi:very-short-patch-repair endonuclease
LPVTTLHRTAFDLARRGPRRRAIADLDALANAARISTDGVLTIAENHPHLRGLRRVAARLGSVDDGAQSPQETYLRLDLIGAGLPAPQTQIPVARPDGRWYYLDMGWPDVMVAVEYDGEQHRTDRPNYFGDVVRLEYLASVGWIVIRVLADHRRAEVIGRVHRAREAGLSRAAG